VQALQAGHRAAIAEEERSGTFNLRVGNIPPQEDVSVELTLVGPLPVAAGEATFRFPLVVAPRYVPGIPLDGAPVGAGTEPDTDQVPDASRVTPPVLLPGFPNPVRLSLEVELDPAGLSAGDGDWTSRVRASLHSVVTDSGPPWTVRLQPGERPNRDFILRFPVAGDRVRTLLQYVGRTSSPPSDVGWTSSPASDVGRIANPPYKAEGIFALTLVPPEITASNRPAPRDVVFVLDRSGSMAGWKMVAARRSVGRMIDTLLEHDRFTILAFDDQIEYPANSQASLVEAGNRQRWRAVEWLGKIESRGGTEMGPALEAAVRVLAGAATARAETISADAKGRRPQIIVLVTDGQVAGEDVVLKTLKKSAGAHLPRIHALGIDQAVNAGFLRRLADLAGGSCDLVESEDRLDAAMDHVHRAIGSPALTQLRVEPLGFQWLADSLVPARLPDLFAERPLTIFGRCGPGVPAIRLRVTGVDSQGRPWQQELSSCPGPAGALESLWGRAKVRELEDLYATGMADDRQALTKQIVEVSLATHVLSRFTAYVAVDRSEVVNQGGRQQHIVQPVEAAEGWDMLRGTGRMVAHPCYEALPARTLACFSGPLMADSAEIPDRLRMARMESSADLDLAWREASGPSQPLRRGRSLLSYIASLFHRKGRGKSPSSVISDLLTDLDEAERLLLSNWDAMTESDRQQGVRLLVERLLRMMEQLIAAMARGKQPIEDIEKVAEQARLLLADAKRDAFTVDSDRLKDLLAGVRAALDKAIGRPGAPPARREQFWT
jgi:Ca-activated chloride channel family protein